MDDFMAPGYVQRIGDDRFPRYVIRDGVGQWWAGEEMRWRSNPSEAVLFHTESAALDERNHYCLGDETFTATVTVTVHARCWSLRKLARFLKRHRKFFISGPFGNDGVLLELHPDTLKKNEQ